MTWNRNNNTLAAVSPDGHIMATPWSKRIEDRLRSLSFRRDESMAVPLSNGEMPAHPDVRKRWEEKQTKAKREIEDIQNDAEKKTG
jgi:hypothetical protein